MLFTAVVMYLDLEFIVVWLGGGGGESNMHDGCYFEEGFKI